MLCSHDCDDGKYFKRFFVFFNWSLEIILKEISSVNESLVGECPQHLVEHSNLAGAPVPVAVPLLLL